jgi:mandelate racemase
MSAASLTVREVRTTPVVAPLKYPVTTASGTLGEAPLLLIDLLTKEGITGRAYLLAYQRLALKGLDELVKALGATLAGQAVVPVELEPQMRARYTLLGGARGLAGIAVSGLDMALWDCLAQSRGVPLVQLLGGKARPVRAYNSLGMVSAANAAEVAARSFNDGFKAAKFKIGWKTFAEDLAAVRAFRKAAPADASLMVDFNQSLSVAEAIRRSRGLDGEGLAWIEEPVRCDDFAGCAEVAAAVETPIQIGENFSGSFEMAAALKAKACDYVMPDPQQIGGVSGWLRAAALAHAAGVECSTHLFIEVSAHLLPVTPTCHWLEFLDVAGAVLKEPATVVEGKVTASARPGNGMDWDEAAVKRYKVE